MTLVEAAVAAGLDPRNRITISPVRAALKLAAEHLDRAVEAPEEDWRDAGQARGSIADMISSQPGGCEEALQRLRKGGDWKI
ncbi:MAG: hypothetical protein WBE91_15410 [Steroidobacteraceae bacterium]